MRYARVESGLVVEPPIVLPDGVTPAEVYRPELAAAFVECPDERVQAGWAVGKDGTFSPPAAFEPDMPALRQGAFERAMTYGNAITAKVTGAYSDVEARTWPLQRAQADAVLGGGTLAPDALLLRLAKRRGVEAEPMALLIQHKAQEFETIADVGQGLRLAAEGLLSDKLDTPEKLDAAVEALRAEADAAAKKLGLAA